MSNGEITVLKINKSDSQLVTTLKGHSGSIGKMVNESYSRFIKILFILSVLRHSVLQVPRLIPAAQRLYDAASTKRRCVASLGDIVSYLTGPGIVPQTSCADSDVVKIFL